jgi:hypothetical protein
MFTKSVFFNFRFGGGAEGRLQSGSPTSLGAPVPYTISFSWEVIQIKQANRRTDLLSLLCVHFIKTF